VKKEVLLWIFLLITLDIIQYYLNNTLITEEILASELSNYLDNETATKLAEQSQSNNRILLKNLTHLLLTGAKVFGTITLLYIGLLLANLKLSWYNLLEGVLKLYPIFFITEFVKFFYFQFFQQDYTYFELNAFRLFSITQISNLAGLAMQGKTAAFFNTFGILDVTFCWLLSQELNKESDKPVTATVFITFFTGLALWKSLLLLIAP
jgi:hypothetical protein